MIQFVAMKTWNRRENPVVLVDVFSGPEHKLGNHSIPSERIMDLAELLASAGEGPDQETVKGLGELRQINRGLGLMRRAGLEREPSPESSPVLILRRRYPRPETGD